MKNLRLLRESHKMSQQKFADQFGQLAQSQIQNYEKGTYESDIATLKQFSDFFDTSVDFLIGRTDVKQKIEPVSEYALNKVEKKLIDLYRRLLPKQRCNLSLFLDSFCDD